jgi:hypothetical protein
MLKILANKKKPKKSEKKKNENQTLLIHMQGSLKEYPNTSLIMNFINCFLFSIYKLACWETSSSNLHL